MKLNMGSLAPTLSLFLAVALPRAFASRPSDPRRECLIQRHLVVAIVPFVDFLYNMQPDEGSPTSSHA
jgi:hypothetical protein